MTELLQRVIAEIEKLPAEVQDALASRILADLAGREIASEDIVPPGPERQGVLPRSSASLSREILMEKPPRPAEGASALEALLAEREESR